MPKQHKLYLCLYWHMHQPDYRDYLSDEFVLPWTYLHAIKDYTDMAFHLEQNPKARANFNFVPVLLDQLEVYAAQMTASDVRDPLLRLLATENLDAINAEHRKLLLDSCFRCNHAKMVAPFPGYHRLQKIHTLLAEQGEDEYGYLSGQYLADLVTWYHLSWIGETVRRHSPLVAALMAKGSSFDYTERCALFELIGDLLRDLVPRYRSLMENGQVEISTTPHFHPILPLLLDFKTAREAVPEMPLPAAECYPGGLTRATRHIQWAQVSHAERFGRQPNGVWPAEGSVSQAALMLLARQGFQWAATGEGVLGNSLRASHGEAAFASGKRHLYKPYRISDGKDGILCFFRDDRLSDKIGFEYSGWHGRDAVNDFVHELELILESHEPGDTPVVSIILDGENAWEYYPYNAYYFLSELYEALGNHPAIEMMTFSDVVNQCVEKAKFDALPESDRSTGAFVVPEALPKVVAGSWVYGNFSTWIGDPAKNRAWELLVEAKQNYDRVMADGRLSEVDREAAERQLADCEGSDWFWWFGDYNPGQSVQSFDSLYRRNLSNLYQLLKLPVPASLSHVISSGGGHVEAGGTMRRGSE